MYYNSDIPKHKVFLSFHHQDDYYRQQFERQFSNDFDPVFVNRSV
ncbi:TIR domain-containing protein [Aggregatibacter sp. 2125159857]|nr:TIR domain-containing protein [Aggregatibacter sp. 2125159857]